MSRERCRDDRGAAVVVALAMMGVLMLVAAVCAGSVVIVLAHRQAQAAADLASLAGASALQRGQDPCPAAAMIAGRQHATLTRCVVEGSTVLVAAAVELPTALGGDRVPARARAGPVPLG